MEQLIVLGITNNLVVKQVEAINRNREEFQLLGFLNKEFSADKPILGYPVLGNYERIPELAMQHKKLVCFNNVNDPISEAKAIDDYLDRNNYQTISIIHPQIDINHVSFGENCMLSEGTVLGSNVRIGRHLTCRLRSIISHDVTIGDYVYISPGVTVCGHATLKDCCDLGAGSTILPRVTIGANSIVGAGAVVTTDVPDNVTVVGVPARVITRRK